MKFFGWNAGVLSALAALTAVANGQGVLRVPGDYPTIGGAIAAAHPGDSVVVSPGRYREAIDFLGKAIVVRGTAPEDPATVAATIIDASGLNRSVVRFVHAETRESRLEGLTVTGGGGSSVSYGGGILISDAQPTVARCVIRNNGAHIGAGINVSGGQPLFSRCRIENNAASNWGGGAYHMIGAFTRYEDCEFVGNSAISGGAMVDSGTTSIIDRCVFAFNSGNKPGYSGEGGSASTRLTNCVFVGNSGSTTISAVPGTVLTQCTVAFNTGTYPSTVECYSPSSLTLMGCIVWGNSGPALADGMVATRSDIGIASGVWPGEGNINEAPQFVRTPDAALPRGDLHLLATSPCVDSGLSGGGAEVDLEGRARPVNGVSDMGAYECASLAPCPVRLVSQAQEQRVIEGYGAAMEVRAVGPGVRYQWFRDGSAVAEGPRVEGTRTARLVFHRTQVDDSGQYRAHISSDCGELVGDETTLTVDCLTIVQQPIGQSVVVGRQISLRAEVSGVPLSYAWERDGVVLVNNGRTFGADSPWLQITGVTTADAGVYRLRMSSGCGEITSDEALVSVHCVASYESPGVRVDEGDRIDLGFSGDGAFATCAWYKDGVALVNDGRVGGTNTLYLSIRDARLADAGVYELHYDTACGEETSGSISVAVDEDCAPFEGSALDLNPLIGLVQIPDNASLAFERAVTFEMWVRPDPSDSCTEILAKGVPDWGHRSSPFAVGRCPETGDVWAEFFLGRDSSRYARVWLLAPGAAPTGRWTHLAVGLDTDAGRCVILVDGEIAAETTVLDGSESAIPAWPINVNTEDLTIGTGESSSCFVGRIAELRLWSVLRTEEQIRTNRLVSIDPAAPGLTGYYRFDPSEPEAARDETGIGRSGQYILTAHPTPLQRCCAADFNGDGGVDGADVEAFFGAWETARPDADVNRDGGVDGGDVEEFFVRWERGGCG